MENKNEDLGKKGNFGEYDGQFVPPQLMKLLEEMRRAYVEIMGTLEFEKDVLPYLEIGKEYRLFSEPVIGDGTFSKDIEKYSGRLAEIDLENRTLALEEGEMAVVHLVPENVYFSKKERVFEPFERIVVPFSDIYTAREKH